MKKRKLVNGTLLVNLNNHLFVDNLKKVIVVFLLFSTFFVKAHTATTATATPTSTLTCTNFKLTTDLTHYNVTAATHDSSFVKYIQFDLSDTVNISKITYTLSNLTASTQAQFQNYTFSSVPSTQNLTVANNCQRNQKNVKISLGYFSYSQIKYLANIQLYDSNNNLLGSSNFNFNH